MNPVVAAIREEIDDALSQRVTAIETLEATTSRLRRLKQTFELYTGEQLDIEIPGLEATGEEDVAPDGDSNRTVIPVPDPVPEVVELPVGPESPADESPPQQEAEIAPEEPAVDSSEAKPEQSKRDIVVSHIAGLDIGREFTLQDIVEETEIHYGIVRDAAKVAVNLDLIDDQGGRPKIFKRIPEGYGTSTEPTDQPAVEEPTVEEPTEIELPEPLYDPEPEDETVDAPTPPAEPIGEQEPPKDFVDQVFDVIKRNGPIPTHELPTVTGIFDGHALKRATSALDADGKIEWHDGAWQLAGEKSTDEAEQRVATEPAISDEERKLREDIVAIVSRRPRTGSQLAEQLSTPIKELDPVLQELKNAGEITRTNFRQWKAA